MSDGKALVTFFMPVTDRDVVIADYAVKSYAKIQGVSFKLVIYSNWVLTSLRERYFTEWRKLPYVEIWENPEHTDDRKPNDRTLAGPFEVCYPIWDRELKKLTDTPFHATVDADFEILEGQFVNEMMRRFEENPRLIAQSTDYSPRVTGYYDTYTKKVISLNERWHTHFCIYRREALDCPVSHKYHVEPQEGTTEMDVWDDTAWLQRALKLQGYELRALERRFQRCFVHYGAFGQNRHIDEHNVGRYRRLKILRQRGAFGLRDPFTRLLARGAERVLFHFADRSTYPPGWFVR